jgi:hypothetical protein
MEVCRVDPEARESAAECARQRLVPEQYGSVAEHAWPPKPIDCGVLITRIPYGSVAEHAWPPKPPRLPNAPGFRLACWQPQS